MNNKVPNILELYRMPWSKNDNPNGWIEITTYCNMACPGCYRGCDVKLNRFVHKPFEEIKKEIKYLIKVRNCQTISISGGEPLLHPELFKIIELIKSQKLNSVLLTNGKILTKDILLKLKKSGLTALTLGIDSLRIPEKNLSEIELNKLRQKFADMVREVGEITLGFTYVVNKNNLDGLKHVLVWARKNKEAVDFLLIIQKRQLILSRKDEKGINLQVGNDEVCGKIYEEDSAVRYCAYLGSSSSDYDIKWLWNIKVFVGEKCLGFFGKKLPEFLEILFHFKENRYFFLLEKEKYSFYFPSLFLLCFICKEWKVLKNVLKNPLNLFKKYKIQQNIVVNPPGEISKKEDFCDSCPDAILYNGRLVPSCALEEIKRFGWKGYEFRK